MGMLLGSLVARLRWLGRGISVRRQSRMLQLCETLQLGEKRFLAVVSVGQESFLVGGAANSVSLLTRLPSGSAQENPETPSGPERVRAYGL